MSCFPLNLSLAFLSACFLLGVLCCSCMPQVPECAFKRASYLFQGIYLPETLSYYAGFTKLFLFQEVEGLKKKGKTYAFH